MVSLHPGSLRSVCTEEFQVVCEHQAVGAFEDAREVVYEDTEKQRPKNGSLRNTAFDVQCRRFFIAYSDSVFL